jgi:hypothetical protein
VTADAGPVYHPCLCLYVLCNVEARNGMYFETDNSDLHRMSGASRCRARCVLELHRAGRPARRKRSPADAEPDKYLVGHALAGPDTAGSVRRHAGEQVMATDRVLASSTERSSSTIGRVIAFHVLPAMKARDQVDTIRFPDLRLSIPQKNESGGIRSKCRAVNNPPGDQIS